MIRGILLVMLGLSCAYWVAAWWCVRAFFRQARKGKDGEDLGCGRESPALRAGAKRKELGVSVLKPVKGVDAGAYENYVSHCRQEYGDFEVLFGVLEGDDPAVEVVRRVQEAFGERKIRLIVGREVGANPKVSILHCLAAEAKGEVLVINDSDIRVSPDYLRRVVADLEDEGTGLVTCLYRGELAESLAARLEGLHMAVVFLPAVLVADRWAGVHAGLGATMALRRRDLERIGGFASIADYLADDYQLAARIRGLGLKVRLSNYVVGSVLGKARFLDQWRREVRWARTIRVSSPWGYPGLLVGFVVLWAMAAGLFMGSWYGAGGVIGGAMLLRGVVAWRILRYLEQFPFGCAVGVEPSPRLSPGVPGEGERMGEWANGRMGEWARRKKRANTRFAHARRLRRIWGELGLLPVRDLMSVMVWCAGVMGRSVTWRGKRFRMAAGGRLRGEGENAAPRAAAKRARGAIRWVDERIRKAAEIHEFSDHPGCVLRIGVGRAERDVHLCAGTRLRRGERIGEIHLWNERIPPIPETGVDLAWALALGKRVRRSLRELAAYVESEARWRHVRALHARSTFSARDGGRQLVRIMERLGFEQIDQRRRAYFLEQCHDLGEDLLLWGLTWAYNPESLKGIEWRRRRRSYWMSRKSLLSRYGVDAGARTTGNG